MLCPDNDSNKNMLGEEGKEVREVNLKRFKLT